MGWNMRNNPFSSFLKIWSISLIVPSFYIHFLRPLAFQELFTFIEQNMFHEMQKIRLKNSSRFPAPAVGIEEQT